MRLKADTPRCVAITRQGEQCTKAAVPETTVCPFHGGKAPLVIAKAVTTVATRLEPLIAAGEDIIERHRGAHTAESDRLVVNSLKALVPPLTLMAKLSGELKETGTEVNVAVVTPAAGFQEAMFSMRVAQECAYALGYASVAHLEAAGDTAIERVRQALVPVLALPPEKNPAITSDVVDAEVVE